jgi:Ser/Thr protein kinase RdoA (MazF antagonist)
VTDEQVAKLCEILALGRPVGELAPVAGGMLHRMWRLETERGAYAVKDVTGAIEEKWYELTERVAAQARAVGVLAVVSLQTAGSPVVRLGGRDHPKVIVYPWIEGEVVPPDPIAPERAALIGEALARLQAIDARLLGEPPAAWSPPNVDVDDFVLRARQAERASLSWAADVRRVRPDMAVWYTRYRQVLPDLYRLQVLGHRDLDQKNVIWDADDRPWLVDWESAGMINPTVELADVALNWSGVKVGEPDRGAFDAVVAAYRANGGTVVGEPRDALYAVLVNWMEWLHYATGQAARLSGDAGDLRVCPQLVPIARQQESMRVGEQTAQLGAEIERFDRESVNTLATVERIATNLDRYASWLAS